MNTMIITGATDGIGKAFLESCFEKISLERWRILAIGRSKTKLDLLLRRQIPKNFEFYAFATDLSELSNIENLVNSWKIEKNSIEWILHSVGTLFPKKNQTNEGIEINFATSFLSRFYLTKLLFENQYLQPKTKLINIAASAPKIPQFLKYDFRNSQINDSRFGMSGHGQAQVANDLWIIEAAKRYGISTLGYGPGSVGTNIRRELPAFFRYLMMPFYALSTRKPEDVAIELLQLFQKFPSKEGDHIFFHKSKTFYGDPWLFEGEQRDLLWKYAEYKILLSKAGIL